MDGIQSVVFKINENIYAIDTNQVDSIIKYESPKEAPNMPECIVGIIDLRGTVVPIVNLKMKFKSDITSIEKKSKIIVSHNNDSFIGFIVDEVVEIITFTENQIRNVPEILCTNFNVYIKCIAKVEENLIPIIDIDKIFTDSEKEIIIKNIENSIIS